MGRRGRVAPIGRIISKKVGIVNLCQLIGANMCNVLKYFGLLSQQEAQIHLDVAEVRV